LEVGTYVLIGVCPEKYREDEAACEIRQHGDMGPQAAASLKGA